MGYSEILRRSFEAVKKHKWLWIWGLFFVTIAGGGGGGFNSSSNFTRSSDGISKTLQSVDFDKIVNLFWEYIGSHYWEIIQGVPFWVWIVVIGVILANWVFFVFYGIFLKNWVKGGMVKLSYEAVSDGEITLEAGSMAGIASFWRLFVASLAVSFLFLGVFLVFFLVGFLFGLIPILGLLLIVLLIPFFIGAVIFLILVKTMADWYIVVDGKDVIQALRDAFVLAKKRLFKLLGMGVINTGISCLVPVLWLMVLIPVGIFLFMGGVFSVLILKMFSLLLSPFFIIIVIAIVVAGSLISAVVSAFRFCNWSLIFKDVTGRIGLGSNNKEEVENE